MPEYSFGVISLPDFLQLATKDEELKSYYQACESITLHRQLEAGNFITAANVAKILFLKDATVEFLKFTGKDKAGNKLEKDVFVKLHDSVELAYLKVDSLM